MFVVGVDGFLSSCVFDKTTMTIIATITSGNMNKLRYFDEDRVFLYLFDVSLAIVSFAIPIFESIF